MRRRILMAIGVLELLAAAAIISFSFAMPQENAVGQAFQKVEKVGRSAEKQVQLMRDQVAEVRHKDFPKAVGELRAKTHAVSKSLNQSIDFQAIESASSALADVFKKLDGWSGALDPRKYLVEDDPPGTHDALDSNAAQKILRAVQTWKTRSAELELDVCSVLAQFPLNGGESFLVEADARRCAHDLDAMEKLLGGDHPDSDRLLLVDLEKSLDKILGQAETISDAVYPSVSTNGASELRPVWPEGKRAVTTLRESRNRIQKCNRDLDEIARSLPPIRVRLEKASRGDSLPEACAEAMWNVDRLRKVCETVTVSLQSPNRIREYAKDIRKTEESIEQAMRNFPELAETMQRSASIFNSSRKKLETLLAQRGQYEQALKSSLQLVRTTEDLLRSGTNKLDVRLGEQEYSLGQMERGLSEANESLPAVAQSAKDLLKGIQWAMWVVGGLIALHGLFVVVDAGGRRFAIRGQG